MIQVIDGPPCPCVVACRPFRSVRKALLFALLASFLLAPLHVRAQQTEGSADSPQRAAEPEKPDELLKKGATDLRVAAEEQVQSFAEYANNLFESVTGRALLGWGSFAVAVLIGLVAMLFGWTLVQSLLVPFAPVWGLATGGVTAFCIVQAFYTGRPTWFRLVVLAVGVTTGLSLYLFSALRAKPVAAFLVIMSPFLILAAFLFPQQGVLGLVIFCAGVLAGFAAMIEVRPLAIISTSMLGAGAFMAAYGLLAHLVGEQDTFAFLRDSFNWLIGRPGMLAIVWGVLTFIGANFQFGTGPRGTLEG
jgi:hypothetical protein